MNEKLSVIITSFDSFSDLWENNAVLFEHHWPNHPPVMLVSNKPNPISEKTGFQFVHLDADYSFRLREALLKIKTEYVFLTLDDYLLTGDVNTERLAFLLRYMEEHGLSYLRLFDRTRTKGWLDKKEGIHALPLTKRAYEVNLYPSIWRKDDLLAMIYRDENPWMFEVRMTRRARERNYKCGWISNKGIFDFMDTIRKGKYLRNAYVFLKKNDLYISDRPIRTRRETVSLAIRTFFARHTPQFAVRFVKRITRKKYYSDYADTDD